MPLNSFFRSVTRRRWAVAGGAAAAVLLAAAALFGPLVRATAERAAEGRGFSIEVGSVSPGVGRVYLHDVLATKPGVPGFRAQLDTVAASVGWGLESVEVHGGLVTLDGDLQKLARELRGKKKEEVEATGADGPTDRLPIAAMGLTIVHRSTPSAPASHVWGAKYARDGRGEEVLEADLVRIHADAVRSEARELAVSFTRNNGQRRLVRATADTVFTTISLKEMGVTPLASSPDDEPSSNVAPDTSPSDDESAGKREPAETAKSDSDVGKKLRAVLDRGASRLGGMLSDGSHVTLNDVRLRLLSDDERLNLGPNRVTVRRSKSSVAVKVVPRAQEVSTPLAAELVLPLDTEQQVTGDLRGGPVSLAALGIQEGDFGLRSVAEAQLRAASRITLGQDGDKLGFDADVELQNISLQHPGLAPEPVRGLDLGVQAKGMARLDGSGFVLDHAEFRFGALKMTASGKLERHGEDVAVALQGGVPLASCEALFESIPSELIPQLEGLSLSGTFAVAGELELDTRQLSEMKVHWKLSNECRFTRIPKQLSPHRFSSSWTRTVKGPEGAPMLVHSGPGTSGWFPYDAISPHMETAVLVCEDGRFFRHDGFDHEAIQKSVQMNVEAGRFVRGGSTISMQLAKNLYLKREKTLSRKLQEAFLTMLLEQELSKQELMELYLNVIEYGPGIYGIGPAAEYYFDTLPSRLTLGQSLYLASILPNPKRHFFDEDGTLKEYWRRYLERLMHIAHKIGRIDEAELERALEQEVVFGQPGEGQPAPEGPDSIPPDDMLRGDFLTPYVDSLLQP